MCRCQLGSNRLGGNRVRKKWRAFWKPKIIRQPLQAEEVRHCAYTARRIDTLMLASGFRFIGEWVREIRH